MSTAGTPTVLYEGKSKRERDLEDRLKYETDTFSRDRDREELDRLRRERNRDNSYAVSQNTQIIQQKKANERDMRAHSGSRFNIRYKDGSPEGAATPEGVMRALDQYVDFSGRRSSPSSEGGGIFDDRPEPVPASSGGGLSALRKGLTIVQVEKILGPAGKISQQNEGSIETVTREYQTNDGLNVKTKCAGGVLIDSLV